MSASSSAVARPSFAIRARRLWAHLQTAAVLDARALALGRMGLAALILYDLVVRSADITAHYSDAGVEPRDSAGHPLLPLFRLYFISGTPTFTMGLFAFAGLTAVALLFGWRTRIATCLSWILLSALHARNPAVLQGGDDLLRMFLLWGMFLPLGAVWSLDAHGKPPSPLRFTGSATFALYGQLFMLYFVTGTLKANLAHWRQGNGIYDALSADYFVTGFGQWIYAHLYLMKALTWGTLLLEIFGPLLFFVPPHKWRLRLGLVVSFIAFHLGISACMRIGMFSFVCVVGWLFLLPTGAFAQFARRDRADAGAAPVPASKPRWLAWLAGALFVYVALAAMVSDRWPKGRFRDAFLQPLHALDLQESWGMFVKPRKHSGFLVAKAKTSQGEAIDLLRAGRPVDWTRPPLVVDLFANQRWRKILTSLTKDNNKGRAERYLRWLCRTHNVGRAPSQRLRDIDLVYVKHEVRPLYKHGPEERQTLASEQCPVE